MALNTPDRKADSFGAAQDRLEYMIDMIKQLQSMSAEAFPTVSRHLKAAHKEADRLDQLRDRD